MKKNLVTHQNLVKDFRNIGVIPGRILMLHASVRSVGWIIGGPDTIIRALLDVLGPEGTLMMYVAWEEFPDDWWEWTEDERDAYLRECPPFDPGRSHAYRKWSILTEYLRTWRGACRSGNPDASVAAVGKPAQWLTENHPLNYGYGPGSPLDKLVQTGGQVLLLGSPLQDITLLHYSEHIADVPGKHIFRYKVPLLVGGKKEIVDVEEFDTRRPIGDWEGDDYFGIIAREYLQSGNGKTGKVGAAMSYLFDAAMLHEFAVAWLERRLGGKSGSLR